MPLDKKLKGKMNKIKTKRFHIAIPSIILINTHNYPVNTHKLIVQTK